MPLQGPFAVIADQPARDVVEALRAAGAYPIIEARWADAAAVLQARPAQAVILAEGCADRARAAVLEKTLNVQAGGTVSGCTFSNTPFTTTFVGT